MAGHFSPAMLSRKSTIGLFKNEVIGHEEKTWTGWWPVEKATASRVHRFNQQGHGQSGPRDKTAPPSCGAVSIFSTYVELRVSGFMT